MEGKSESKKPSTSIKKVNSFKAESETQTAVAVRVPSFSQNEAKEAAERIVTDEQTHSASMARKRRLMTKNRAQGVRTREKTPEPSKSSVTHEDTTTTDEEDSRSAKNPTEKEADDIYAEMRRKLQEKNNDRDDDDIDIDAIREQQIEDAKERRRRSISPFALPSKEDIARLQRKGSFIDPGNKLLSTVPTYAITPKDDIINSNSRKSSLVRDEGLTRKDSLIVPPSPTTPGRQSSPFQLSTPPSPRKTEQPVSTEKNVKQDTNLPKSPSIKQNPVTVKPKQSSLKGSANINTSIVNRPQDPSQKITSVSPNAGNMSTNTAHIQKPDPSNAPPIKPKRSKSGTRSQGRTSESEMSDDQNRRKVEQQPVKPPKPKERRRTIAAIKRSVRERSPTAKRSQSATRADQPLDVTGIELTQTTSEIIDLLQKARRRSISIPDEDLKLSSADYTHADKSRQLMTPNKTPSTPKKGLKITSPKKIEILSQEEMMESFQKAQRKSMEIERSRRSSGYIDASQSEITSSCYSSSNSEDESDFDITKRSAELARKLALLQKEKETVKTKENKAEKPPFVQPEDEMAIAEAETKMSSMRIMFRNARRVWKVFIVDQKADYDKIKALRNRCFNDLIIMLIFCGVGGFVFRYTEGAFENFYKCGVRRVKRDFIDSLWQGSHNMREDDWKSMARKKLWEFESQLHTAHEAGVHSYSGQKSWSFMNSVVYCLTVVTTIGYGHIAPSTTTGRAITIVYAIFGIPLFLILLADFGKLFTRCIKFLWAFVRRLYYTGSCRKVRKTVQVQEVMKGLNMVYEAASTFRRPSQYNLDDPEGLDEPPPKLPPKPISPKPQTPSSGLLNVPPSFKRETTEDGVIDMDPQTPAPSVFEIDDEFNLPISVAITCLIIYIFLGASIYVVWEDWGFFESFYFVFISMSTIGFGDFVPNHPMYMMGSIIYLVFGMALTSMCINVVQVKLSDSFRQASAKIGATIGLRVSEEDGSLAPVTPAPVEVPAVHGGSKTHENNAPVAV